MKELEIYKTYTHSNIKEEMDKMINSVIKSLSDDYYYLNVNRANGAKGAIWFSGGLSKEGIKTKDEEIEYWKRIPDKELPTTFDEESCWSPANMIKRANYKEHKK